MFYESEFDFLRETLQKCGLSVTMVSSQDTFLDLANKTGYPAFEKIASASLTFDHLLGGIRPKTFYKFKDAFSLSYAAFLLPQSTGRAVVIIGPFLQERIGETRILEIYEQNGFEPKHQKSVNELFSSLPIVPTDSPIHVFLDSFCERMWDGSYVLFDVVRDPSSENAPFMGVDDRDLDDTFLDMKNMERRYAFENELMDVVAHGSEHKLARIFPTSGDAFFEKRASDPVRNAKNYCIIMNTLLRKAAERGGVHPMYLNKVSTGFALKIEQFTSLEQGGIIMSAMVRDYCRLVRKHSSATYSPLVKAAVTAIDSNLSSELSLHSLAKQLNVSNVYLSSVFRKETGQTITDYIAERRIAYAKHLLRSTSLQVQTISLHCGMADVHYFSKLFKRRTGKTPTAFRAETKRAR